MSRVRTLRTKAGMSQAELARRANVARRTVQLLESGRLGVAKLETLRRIAAALGCAVQDLIAEQETSQTP